MKYSLDIRERPILKQSSEQRCRGGKYLEALGEASVGSIKLIDHFRVANVEVPLEGLNAGSGQCLQIGDSRYGGGLRPRGRRRRDVMAREGIGAGV